VIFHQENHHAVGELDPLRLWQLDLMQGRGLDVVIVGNLGEGRQRQKRRRGRDRMYAKRFHFVSPFGAAGVAFFADSIMAVVRLVGTNVALATRLMSAAVTLSIFSTS
jgi:hypothetical protein